MINKVWQFFQYGYLLVAIICLIEGALMFNTNKNTAIILLFFAVVMIVVFLIKRKFRKKVIERNNQNKK
ncbi:hypothetical protein [Polaribacter tangerinus]|uniref:hypothetical protein n=1 Tax=Polaribacter tangerinus TaxID=1920034 RepID=UPI001E51B18E|nr:hypothetical protein [Polaribacter tangerinus]